MWMISVSLMAMWMMCVVLGLGRFGVEHLLAAAAIAIELLHRPRARRPQSLAH
jgi:hypothetical protein